MSTVSVRIENAYSDGHESVHEVVVRAPSYNERLDEELEEWWEDVVWPETGDGHNKDKDLGSCFVATIIGADEDGLIGRTFEWMSS